MSGIRTQIVKVKGKHADHHHRTLIKFDIAKRALVICTIQRTRISCLLMSGLSQYDV